MVMKWKSGRHPVSDGLDKVLGSFAPAPDFNPF